LEALADRNFVSSLEGWSELPIPDIPLIFSGIEGEDLREGDSPSFFNRVEVIEIVRRYISLFIFVILHVFNICDSVQSLVNEKNVNPVDIGVISSYYKQVQKIRFLLRQKGLDSVRVGSTEEFQVLFVLVIITDFFFLGTRKKSLVFVNRKIIKNLE